MTQSKRRIIVLVTLVIGFAGGFLLRPVIVPAPVPTIVGSPPAMPTQAEPRGKQYFAANLDEARRVVAGCRDGSVRGDECVNSEVAVVEADSKERFRRFRDR